MTGGAKGPRRQRRGGTIKVSRHRQQSVVIKVTNAKAADGRVPHGAPRWSPRRTSTRRSSADQGAGRPVRRLGRRPARVPAGQPCFPETGTLGEPVPVARSGDLVDQGGDQLPARRQRDRFSDDGRHCSGRGPWGPSRIQASHPCRRAPPRRPDLGRSRRTATASDDDGRRLPGDRQRRRDRHARPGHPPRRRSGAVGRRGEAILGRYGTVRSTPGRASSRRSPPSTSGSTCGSRARDRRRRPRDARAVGAPP